MTIVDSVGWVLLHFLWQGAAVAAALWVAVAVASPARAATRYALGCGALLLMLLAPIVTAVRLVTGAPVASRDALAAAEGDTAAALATPRAALEPDTARAPLSSAPRSKPGDRASERAWLAETIAGAPWSQVTVDAALPWLVVCWAAGVVLLSIRLLGGWWRTRELRTTGVLPAPQACQELLARVAARMRVTRAVTLTLSERLSVPVVVGHIKPMVLLPVAALSGLSFGQLEAILAHELAHVRRHDYLVNLAQTVIETLLFYHPAVWWVSRQVRLAREHCCDDLAVAASGDRKGYVEALLGLEQLRPASALLALGITDGPLLARARRVLADAESQAATPRLAASAIALTVAALAVAGVSTASEQPLVDASIVEESSPWRSGVDGASTEKSEARTASEQPDAVVPVITAPEPGAPLATRLAWGAREARAKQAPRYWLAYGIAPVRTLPPLVYLDRSGTIVGHEMTFRGHVLSSDGDGLTFPGRRLAIAATDPRSIKLLFEFDAKGGSPALVAVHASTLPLPVDLDDRPVFWLGSAQTADSLKHIDELYGGVSNRDLRNDLIASVGVHDDSPAVVTWLERRVAGNDAEDLRADAAEWMAWHPIPAALTALDRIARADRSSRVRQEAAEAIGDLALPQATEVLIALARSLQDLDARREAVEALGARPELAARDALGAIAREDTHLDIQGEAVETLGDYKDQRGVPLLIELSRKHPSPQVRREAIETLGEALPKETAVPLLKQLALEDPDPGVQEEAVDTLADVDHEDGLSTLMELARSHPRSQVRREAVEALAHRASAGEGGASDRELAVVVDLLAQLSNADRDFEVQLEAVETLGELPGPKAIEQLRALAQTHARAEVRREAVEALVEHATPAEALATLRTIIQKDADESVRIDAVERLAQVHDPEARAALRDLARTHRDESTRAEAVESLGETAPAAEMADTLKDIALAEKSSRVRDEALETLAELPGGAGVAALVELARAHPDAGMRKHALEALLESDHPQAREVFERALQKPPSR